MGNYENNRNGGNLPLNVREVFHDAVEGFVHWHHYAAPKCPELTIWFDEAHGEITLSRACGLVWNCINILPVDVKVRIDWLAGEQMKGLTYACGARRLLRLINWRKGLQADRPRVSFDSLETTTDECERKAHEAMLALVEMFSNLPNSNNTNNCKYTLELKDGHPVFRRDEICLAVENAFEDVFGPSPDRKENDIVPQKLAKLFPGSFKTLRS